MRQPVFQDQVLNVFLIKHLDVDVGIDLAQQADLAVFSGHQRLFHGGQFDVEIQFRQVKIRGEALQHSAVLIPGHGKLLGSYSQEMP